MPASCWTWAKNGDQSPAEIARWVAFNSTTTQRRKLLTQPRAVDQKGMSSSISDACRVKVRRGLRFGVGEFGLAFLLHRSGGTENASSISGAGVGLAPPPSFQFATLQISSMPSSLGFPSLPVRPYSLACLRNQISSAFFGVFPFNPVGSAVTSFQARTAAASFGA